MKLYLRLISYIKIYKRYIFISLLLSLLLSIFSALSIYLTIPLLRTLFLNNNNPSNNDGSSITGFYASIQKYFEGYLFQYGKINALGLICIFIFVSFIFKNITAFYQSLSIQKIEKAVLRDLRDELYRKINRLSIRYFTTEKTGNIISNMTNDLNNVQSGISAAFSNLIKEPLLIIVFLFLAFSISWKMTLISIIVFPITILFISKIGSSLRRRSQRVQEKLSEILTTITETIYGAKIIRAFRAEEYRNNFFKKQNEEQYKLVIKAAKAFELSSPITEIFSILAGIIIIWYGGQQILVENSLRPEDFLGFLFIIFQLMVPIKNLSTVNNRIQESSASSERIFKLLDTPIEIEEKDNAVELKNFQNEINIKNVSFNYNDDINILKDLSFNIKKSEVVAIVGPSGSGKSTLADLIARFYDVSSGEISLDGINIKDLKLESLRKLIGIVPQETILFNDTIRNNIIFGLENISEDDLINAAKNANAYEFIQTQSSGFDTIVGERGLKLSGGQKQRIAIARALLRNPQILILDEATSSLDTESEKIVQQALDNLMVNRTSIVIAHRLSTVINADKIIVLDNHKIVQQGTHTELIKIENGLYKKLYEIQFSTNNV